MMILKLILFVSDCTAPFNLNFVTNSEVADAGTATVTQRGENIITDILCLTHYW